jgi:hypothetical protein
MQSLTRQIRRGNAYIYYDNVTKNMEVMQKRGCDRRLWWGMMKNRDVDFENRYCDGIVKPIRKWKK